MVREGYYFGLPPLVVGAVAVGLHWILSGIVLLAMAAFIFCFFRDPERRIPLEPGKIVSPADGRVMVVTEEELGGKPGKRISIFLAIWNVHVNRAPEAGTISRMDYRAGKFFVAMRERASLQNEQNVIHLTTGAGEIVFKQIAGWIARRVVCWKKAGEEVARGERIGLVRFGSRVDLWLPRDAEILVAPGQTVQGGSSVLARWPVIRSRGASDADESTTADSPMVGAGNRA